MRELFLRKFEGNYYMASKKTNNVDIFCTIRELGLVSVMRCEDYITGIKDEISIYYDNVFDRNISKTDATLMLLNALIEKGYVLSKDMQERLEFYKAKKQEEEDKKQKAKELYEAKKQEERKKQEEESKYEYRYYCPMLDCEITTTSCKRFCPQQPYNQGCKPIKVKLLKEI